MRCLVSLVFTVLVGCAEGEKPGQTSDAPKQARVVAADTVSSPFGVYCTTIEIADFSGTVLQLSEDGRFRYWFYTDVIGPDEPEYPITGAFSINGNTVTLDNEWVNQQAWHIDVINNVSVLLRDDARRLWNDKNRLYDYGILIRIAEYDVDGNSVVRPSISVLYDDEMKLRIKEWKDPFIDSPLPRLK